MVLPHSVKDHTTGIGKDLTFTSILGIKKNTFLTQEVVFIGENYSAKMAVSSVVKTNFLKGEVDFSLWRRELETTREKIIPPAMRCIKKDRVVGVLWINKINLQVIFCKSDSFPIESMIDLHFTVLESPSIP